MRSTGWDSDYSGDDGHGLATDLRGTFTSFGSEPRTTGPPLVSSCLPSIKVVTSIKDRKQPTTNNDTMTSSQGFISVMLHRVHAWLTTFILYLLALGPMPRHIGFVMDGNRRYARTKGMKVTQGHTDGFQSLRRVSLACRSSNMLWHL